MGRAGAAGLNVGRAALLIVVGLLIGVFVLNQGDDAPSPASFDTPPTTSATIPEDDFTTNTTRASTATTAPLRRPETFKSVAINATNTTGVAGKATTKLTNAGYNALAPGTATPSVKASTRSSLVLYKQGFDKEALAVASLFGLPASSLRPLTTPPPSPDVKDASIVLLVGPDLKF